MQTQPNLNTVASDQGWKTVSVKDREKASMLCGHCHMSFLFFSLHKPLKSQKPYFDWQAAVCWSHECVIGHLKTFLLFWMFENYQNKTWRVKGRASNNPEAIESSPGGIPCPCGGGHTCPVSSSGTLVKPAWWTEDRGLGPTMKGPCIHLCPLAEDCWLTIYRCEDLGPRLDFFMAIVRGCILSSCLFNLYAEYIMHNAGLGEAQAGIKFSRRNTSNLRYADDTTFMAESKKELKSLLMEVKEENEKAGLNSTFKKRRSWHLVPSLHGK